MRKSQIIGQVFIYSMAAITFGLILLFGYKAVSNLTNQGKSVSLLQLRNDVQTAINSIGSSADVEKAVLRIPSGYSKICFLGNVSDVEKLQTCLCDSNYCGSKQDFNPVICNAWKSSARQNVFLYPMADVQIVVGKLDLIDRYLCVPVKQGKVELRLQGLGDATRISAWG
ncbi:MAG: hypothetical protein V1837_07130 [Candidatus Woesearchaeota archaeon]